MPDEETTTTTETEIDTTKVLDASASTEGETEEQKAAREALEQETAKKAEAEADKAKKEAEQSQRVATSVADAVRQALTPQMTPQQQDEQLAKLAEQRGVTVETLKAQFTDAQNAALQAQLPMARELGTMKAERALGEYSEDLLKDVEEMMGKMPIQAQANPKAWEEAAYLIMGKKMKTLKPKAKANEETTENEQRRVITSGTGTGLTQTKTGAMRAGTTKKVYSDAEKFVIDRQFGGKADEYEKFRGTKTVNHVEKFSVPANGANRADAMLEQMTRENT